MKKRGEIRKQQVAILLFLSAGSAAPVTHMGRGRPSYRLLIYVDNNVDKYEKLFSLLLHSARGQRSQ